MKSKKIRWLIWAGVIAATLFVAATVAVSVLVPRYLTTKLIPEAAQKYGLDARQVQIRRIGWFGADLGPIQLNTGKTPVVNIAAVHINYSPFSLFKGKINSIGLGGLRIVIAASPTGLSIPGFKLPPEQSSEKGQGSFPDLDALLPVGVGQFHLNQSEVVVLWKGRPISISIDMTLACGALRKGRLTGNTNLSFLGSTMALTANLDQGANSANLTLESGHFLISPLAGFADLPKEIEMAARAMLKGRSSFQLAPFELKGLSLDGHLMETKMAFDRAVIQNLPIPSGDVKPIAVSLEAHGPAAIKWHCGPFLITAPVDSKVLALAGEWMPARKGWSLDASAKMLFPIQSTDAGITLSEELPMTWQVQAYKAAAGAIEFTVHTAEPAPLALESARFKIACPTYEINAAGRHLPGQPWHYQANLKLAKAGISNTAQGIKISGIRLDLPLHWPPQDISAAGTLKVQRIHWRHHRLGDLKGRLQQKDSSLLIDLQHNSRLFPQLNVLINGSIDAGGGAIKASLPEYRFPRAVDLGRFFPVAAGILAEGQIKTNVDLTMEKGILKGSATINVRKGSLQDTNRELNLEGIHADIQLDDLMAFKSAPQQNLRVARLSFGKIKADDFEMNYQLEGRQTVFIEKTRIQWCRGRINSTAFRIAPEKEAYDVTLFCDRLNLAMVLEQLGAGQANGDGTVNGSIPIKWQKGRLSFDNGFLYSTPGKPGVIQLAGTEVLLQGLPPETPQHTQVDIATEALKDYTYKWAKLHVASQNDNLVLKLQLDGKPNRLLPFAFDKQLGRFKRVAGQGQADFKGISIDLNFNSPLDKILHYKQLLTPNH